MRLFPAAFQVQASRPPVPAGEGEATCFDHPGSSAVAACGHCGRFVCPLCEVDTPAGPRCPACLAAGQFGDGVDQWPATRTAFDSIALSLVVFPILFWPLLFVTIPAAIFIVFRYWKRPLPLLHANRWRFVVTPPLALVDAGIIALMIFSLALAFQSAGIK